MSAPAVSAKAIFDPSQHLTRVGGSDYLEVKWRLVWLRSLHPDATMETQLVDHVDDVAIFRAEVRIPEGGSATGWGSESAGDFRDYLEKAETKAIGRALAALGFGTQFCADHEVLGGSQSRSVVTDLGARRAQKGDDELAPPGQIRYLRALAHKLGIEDEVLEERANEEFGVGVDALTRGQATRLHQLIREVPKPAPSSSPSNAQRAPAALPGVTAARGIAGDDPNTR
jgi:hypothetical protein